MNVPDRFELFVLPDGVKKYHFLLSVRVTIDMDKRIPNLASFEVQKEDHTLGNLICR